MEPPKVVRNAGVLCILTCKCAWRQSGVPFFNTFSTSQKVARACQFFSILTHKCASRYSGVQFFNIWTSKSGSNLVCFVHFDLQMCYSSVQFFDIWTSKSGPNMVCFVHFDLQMCFAPQRCAIFPHRNFKKWSENAVSCAFWLGNVLRVTGVQFFDIWTSKSGPNMVCFVHFDLQTCFSLQRRAIFHFSSQQLPPHPPLYRGYFSSQPTDKSLKNTAFRDFPSISRLLIFFVLTFAQLYQTLLLFSAFHLLTLLLCSAFSTVHIVGS